MPTVTINFAGVDYKAYASVADTTSYLAGEISLYSAWDALSDDDKARYVISASREIDANEFSGESGTGGLKFPLSGQTDIPPNVIEAMQLTAGRNAVAPPVAAAESRRVKSQRAGRVRIEYYNVPAANRPAFDRVNERIAELLSPYLAAGTSVRTARSQASLERRTDTERGVG